MVRKNSSSPLAGLSDAQLRTLGAELRSGLQEVLGPLRDKNGDQAAEGGEACKTCGGTGRLRHPRTGKPGVKCPSCDGTGIAPDEDDDGQGASASSRYARHIRFERGQATVMNSARRPGQGDVWAELARLARDLEEGRSR